MATQSDYVKEDEHGVLRIGGSRVMLDSVITGFQQGYSPETIQSQYPSLTLEEVYGAIAWCLAHQAEVEAYLRRQGQAWDRERERSEQNAGPLMDRMRQAKRTGAAHSS